MYTACTARLARVVDAPFLAAARRAFIYVALAAWGVTLAGMAASLLPSRRAGAR